VTEIQRFRNEVEGTELQRLHSRLHVAVGRDDRDRHAGRMVLHPLDELQAVAVGQAHIRETDIELLLAQQGFGAGHVHRRPRPDIHAAQRQRQ
jgi:hypothetical protein